MATKMNAGMDINTKHHPDGAKYNEQGEEMMDPTPVALPMAFRRPENIGDMMKRLIRTHLSRAAAAENAESFDEADDFEIEGEEKEPQTPYEDDLEGLDCPAVNEPRERHEAFKKKLKALDDKRKNMVKVEKAQNKTYAERHKALSDEIAALEKEKPHTHEDHHKDDPKT